MMETMAATLPARKPYSFTNGKLAMWLFLGSDAMGFMGLIGAYIVLRITSPDWMNPKLDPGFGINLTGFMTFLLIVSSVTMVTALVSAANLAETRAVQLFEWMGQPDSRRVLEKLAAGAADAHLTREAQAALARLSRLDGS